MEHIVQFAIGIDDEAIRKRLEENLEKAVKENMTRDFREALRTRCGMRSFEDAAVRVVNGMTQEILDKHKEAVIAEAAKILADRIFRSKAGKEILKDVVESGASAE